LQPEDDADNTVGRYATLTINLAEPVQIKSVTMEHAPRDLTPTPDTAIRDFRVIGYEGTDANGTPIPLGSFRYEIDGPRTLQDFEVESEHNEALYLMKSVTLAIDSNWGADYSCLYRFRVHGDRSVPLPQSSVHASCE
jgi:SUN domain-containing protein 1/2